MSVVTRFRLFRDFPLILMLLTVLAGPCLAVGMDVTVGFDGNVKSLTWSPIAVRLTNRGADTVEGILQVAQKNSDKQLPRCLAAVSLPPNSTKLYHVYIKFPAYGDKVVVTLSKGWRLMAKKEIPWSAAANEDRLLVFVGPRSSRFNFLTGETVTASVKAQSLNPGSSSGQGKIVAGSIPAVDLSDRPAAYDGVDAMFMSDFTPSSVSPKVLKALSMWVASGGSLVVSTGAEYRRFQNEFFDELLPVRLTGVANLDLVGSSGNFGPRGFPEPVAVAASAVKPGIGQIVASKNGIPVVATRRYGLGQVTFLAFDSRTVPARDWPGQTRFWKTILSAPTDAPLVSSTDFDPNNNQWQGYPQTRAMLAMAIQQSPAVKIPSFNAIMFFLIAYLIFLAPVNYSILKWKKRLELAWVTTPAIVLLFTFGAYAIGYTVKGGRLQITEGSFIEASSNARYARMITNASLFSPARRSYDLSASDPYGIPQALAAGQRDSVPPTMLGEQSVIPDVNVPMWADKTFESISGADLGGVLKTDLVLTGDVLRGEIRNDTNIDLRDCRLVYGNNVENIGGLRKGEAKTIRIQAGPGGQFIPTGPNPRAGGLRAGMRDFTDNVSRGANSPILLGNTYPGKQIFGLLNGAPSKSMACYAFRLDYRVGGTFTLNSSAIGGRIISYEGCSPEEGSKPPKVQFYGQGSFVAAYQMPSTSQCVVKALTVEKKIGASYGGKQVMNISIRKRTGGWERLKGGARITIQNPSQYVNDNGEVRIKAELTSGSQVEAQVGVSVTGAPK
ncbi:MAG: hypothetical protein Q7N50_14225 [Armatimonadota bacterium]|nr:hypothetical protein [Armatimonadota bacterium]